jgi:hypothetical protein
VTALRRLASVFVEPGPRAADWAPPVPAAMPASRTRSVAVLSRPREAALAGGVAGLALLRRSGAPTVVVCEWGGESRGPGLSPATPAASRRAALLGEHGLSARGEGRLVRVVLGSEEAEAAREIALVTGEGLGPVVLVLAGPRGRALDAVLATQDVALVVRGGGDGDTFAELAARELGAAIVELRAGPVARAVASRGLTLAAPLRRAVEDALT